MSRGWLRDRVVPLVVALAVAGACGSNGGAVSSRRSTTTASTAPVVTTTTTPTPTTPPSTTPPSTEVPDAVALGAVGSHVYVIERRLAALGYWPGVEDGVFDGDTFHAVVALQKTAGFALDGVVRSDTQRALDDALRPVARSTAGRVIEVDRTRQILLVVDSGVVTTVLDTSTGSARNRTPAGRWQVEREIDGLRRSRLGLLYRPKYFHRGVAIHGYTSVPAYPASHSCVRLTYHAMDYVWASGFAPRGTPVWVY